MISMEANFSSEPPSHAPPKLPWRPPPVQSTPRRIHPSVRWRILFGSPITQVGWGLFGFTMIFFWTFGIHCDIPSLYKYRGKLVTAQAIVTDTRHTMFSEGGSKTSKGTPVIRNEFSFQTPTGRTIKTSSYALGRELVIGSPVDIEYPAGEPEAARIVGMRTRPMSAWLLFVLVFPAAGLGMLLIGMTTSARNCSLLEHGRLAGGHLKEKTPTNTRVNGRRVYRMVFTFIGDDGKEHLTTVRSHMTEKLEDEELEPLFFDPNNPTRAVVLGGMPGPIYVDPQGEFHAENPSRNLAVLVLPAAAVLIQLLAAWLYFR